MGGVPVVPFLFSEELTIELNEFFVHSLYLLLRVLPKC